VGLEQLEDRLTPAPVGVDYSAFGNGVVVDSLGNTYAAGAFSGWVDLDLSSGQAWISTPSSAGHRDGYLAKYSPAGAFLWGKQMAAPGINGLAKLAVDENDNLYVVGGFSGTVTFDTATLTAEAPRAAFVAKLAPDGTVLWARKTADAANNSGSRVAVDELGNVYVSGIIDGTGDFDPGPGTYSLTADSQDAYVTKLDANGDFVWVHQLGGPNAQSTSGVAVDAAGVYVTGSFGVMGLDRSNGFPLWPAQHADGEAGDIAADAAGHVYVTGRDLAADRLFVAQLDTASGDFVWEAQWGTTFKGYAWGIAAREGYLHVTGSFGTTVDFNPDPNAEYSLTSSGYADIFVLKLTTAGAFVWARQMGSPYANNGEGGNDIAVDASGNVVTTGWFEQGADFDPDPNQAAILTTEPQHAFVSKLGADGTYRWALQIGAYVKTIDDGDAGYQESGTGWKSNPAGTYSGFQNDYRYHAKGSGANKATWTFTGLQPGSYEVLATWVASGKNARNAQYRVNGTAAPTVSQRVAPDDYGDTSSPWESLGVYTVDGTATLTVELSDKADGTVIADAIQLVGAGPAAALQAAGGAASGKAFLSHLRPEALAPLITDAVSRWEAAGLSAGRSAALRDVSVQVADLGGATLGPASGNTVWLDDNAAGWGWFVDPTPWEDFEFTMPGDQGEQDRMDLLTVLAHELGHLLGREHDDEGVMQETLATGTRLLPATSPEEMLAGDHEPSLPAGSSLAALDHTFAMAASRPTVAWDDIALALALDGDARRKDRR
jgi:hypothetical protein